MVARTAYSQLQHSPLLLLGTVIGMALLYLAPPLIALTWSWHGEERAVLTALTAWGLMALTYLPTLRLYGRPPWESIALPVAATLYTAMTISSRRTPLARSRRSVERSHLLQRAISAAVFSLPLTVPSVRNQSRVSRRAGSTGLARQRRSFAAFSLEKETWRPARRTPVSGAVGGFFVTGATRPVSIRPHPERHPIGHFHLRHGAARGRLDHF